MKRCFRCGSEKPLTEFYRHSKMRDGHLGKCKECTKADERSYYRKNAERIAKYEQGRNREPSRKAAKVRYQKTARKKYPQKAKAYTAVANAKSRGKLVKQPCVYCGSLKTQAHHHDYSKPLDVTWVCFRCHREKEHGQTVHTND